MCGIGWHGGGIDGAHCAHPKRWAPFSHMVSSVRWVPGTSHSTDAAFQRAAPLDRGCCVPWNPHGLERYLMPMTALGPNRPAENGRSSTHRAKATIKARRDLG